MLHIPRIVETYLTIDAQKIILSFSGFDVSELCGLRRLLRALGIKLAPKFSKNTTHLLCPSATGPKFAKACEWGKPVVKMSWLAAMASTGVIPSLEGHLVLGSIVELKNPPKLDSSVSMEVFDVDVESKAKAFSCLPSAGTRMDNIRSSMLSIDASCP